MRWLGVVAAATVAMGLGGCSPLTTGQPIFGPADVGDAPRLREGLWVASGDDCRIPSQRPLAGWPRCAKSDTLLVRGGEALSLHEEDARVGRYYWASWPYVVVDGVPLIVQTRLPENPFDDLAQPLKSEGDHMYFALEIEGRDLEGGVTALLLYLVTCGPEGEHDAPWPGVRQDPQGGCIVDGPAAVREAARRSRAQQDGMHFRWIREARPDDFAKASR